MRLAAALILLATNAEAGAWPRAPGDWFVSVGTNYALSENARRPVYYDPTLYIEHGLRPGTTLGFDAYSADGGDEMSALLFWRQSLTAADATAPLAVTFALGYREREGFVSEDLTRVGLSWGRGTGWGWLAVDVAGTYSARTERFDTKFDSTIGYVMTDRWTGVAQLQTGIGTEGTAYAKIAPATIFELRDGIRVELGAVQSLTGDFGQALRANLWFDF